MFKFNWLINSLNKDDFNLSRYHLWNVFNHTRISNVIESWVGLSGEGPLNHIQFTGAGKKKIAIK